MRATCISIVVLAAISGAGWSLRPPVASAQPICGGDINGDGIIDSADLSSAVPLLFDTAGTTARMILSADANGDGFLNAADLIAVLQLGGLTCGGTPLPSATSTAVGTPLPGTPTATGVVGQTTTPTPTRTRTPLPASPTPTFTPRPTFTPTPACLIQPAQLGTTAGELTADDCVRTIAGKPRFVDVYSVTGTVGQAITVGIASAGGLVPFAEVVDADGQFERIVGPPPITFVVTTTRPYEVWVSTGASSPTTTGAYQLQLQATTCPTPIAVTLQNSRVVGSLDPTDCPDPGGPSVAFSPNPADLYTLTVNQVPTNVSITMRQLSQDDDIDPALSIIGPDGFEIVTTDEDDDNAPGGFGSDAQANFLAIEPGTYTIIALGNGGTGRYSLFTSTRIVAANNNMGAPCTASSVPIAPGGSTSVVNGTLYGDPLRTGCAAPVPQPNSDTPTPNSPADMYTVTVDAGDVISVEMDSDDDAHLFLLGPQSAGNPLVAEDDDSGPLGGTSDSTLAATIRVGGVYTIIAANNNVLAPPDPTVPGDTGDSIGYTLLVQVCGLHTPRLDLAPRDTITGTLNTADCSGFGGVPFRTYAFAGHAGEFASVLLSSGDFDAAVRVLAPDGSVVVNDNDPFDPFTTDARANRILPVDGTYLVEVSAALDQGSVDLTQSPGFTLSLQTCAILPAGVGILAGSFADTDCRLDMGQPYDVYTLSGGASPRAFTLLPPAAACVLALLPDGTQTPAGGCATGLVDVPIVEPGTYGFMVAANDSATRGAYQVPTASCPLNTMTFGDVRNGTLTAGSCRAADNTVADWYLIEGPAPLIAFNEGVSGTVDASFAPDATIIDVDGPFTVLSSFSDDPSSLFALGNNGAALLRIRSAGALGSGHYTVTIDPAAVRQ